MRNTLLFAAFAAIPLSAGCGVYYAIGPSSLPYQGQRFHRTEEIQLGLTRPQFPHWVVALAVTAAQGARDSAAFVEPTCYSATPAEVQAHKASGCHPGIFANVEALEVQYRWLTTRSVRPVASLSFGSLRTAYVYRTLETYKQIDSAQRSQVVTLRGGGELSLAPWVHVALLAGYREAFRNSSLNKTVSNSGFTVSSLLIVGKRY